METNKKKTVSIFGIKFRMYKAFKRDAIILAALIIVWLIMNGKIG